MKDGNSREPLFSTSRSIIPWRASAGGHESTRERLPRLPSSRNSQLMTEAHTICKKIDATYYLVGDQSIIQKKSKRHSVIDCAYECWHKQEALSLLAGTFLDIIN